MHALQTLGPEVFSDNVVCTCSVFTVRSGSEFGRITIIGVEGRGYGGGTPPVEADFGPTTVDPFWHHPPFKKVPKKRYHPPKIFAPAARSSPLRGSPTFLFYETLKHCFWVLRLWGTISCRCNHVIHLEGFAYIRSFFIYLYPLRTPTVNNIFMTPTIGAQKSTHHPRTRPLHIYGSHHIKNTPLLFKPYFARCHIQLTY